MHIKGLDALRRHVPELQQIRGTITVILAFVSIFILTTLFFILVDLKFVEWLPDGEVVIMALGFLLMSRFFSQKIAYMQRYGELAYRNAFARFNIPGLSVVFASIVHLGYIAGPEIPNIWWKPVLVCVGWVFLFIGAVLWLRSVASLGIDRLAMLYVYFPSESRLINSGIYQIFRHPVYASALYIGIGLALIHANWYALLVAIILPIFLTGWVRLVEEKELIKRFPDYIDYRKALPAFSARPRDIFRFIRYLISG